MIYPFIHSLINVPSFIHQLEEDSTLTPACLCPEGQLHDNDVSLLIIFLIHSILSCLIHVLDPVLFL